jgi:hypothetical protein
VLTLCSAETESTTLIFRQWSREQVAGLLQEVAVATQGVNCDFLARS